jgi:excisionase family DNA binding protein
MSKQITVYTTTQVANRAFVDSSTVRIWVAKGLLKPIVRTPGGHYRFDAAEVDAFLTPQAAA